MKPIRELYHTIKNSSAMHPAWAGPVLLFVTTFFTFGVLLARLGYFQDDWHHIYYAFIEGQQGLMRFLFTDSRPLAFVVYVPFFKLLGFDPANWHWSLMILRFLTVLTFWFLVRMVWPNLNGMATWVALIFAVYPAYSLQSLSVAYTLHWFIYFIFLLSVSLMVMAARQPGSFLKYGVLSITLQVFHLLMIEYYAGLEIIRPLLLWMIYRELPYRQRGKKVIKQWFPYLVILSLYAVYRLSYDKLFGYDRFASTLLTDLLRSPLTQSISLIQSILQDTIFVLITPWYNAIDPAAIDFSRGSTFQIIAAIAGFILLSFFVVSRLEKKQPAPSTNTAHELTWLGALAVIVGLLPSWLAGLYLFSKNPMWSGRLALPALLGGSMILTGLVYLLVEKPSYRHVILSIFLGLAVGFQAQAARDFQTSWDKQRQFFWQLFWRAPGLKDNTLIVSDAEILPLMGYYPTAFAINVLYTPNAGTAGGGIESSDHPRYWFNAGSEHINLNEFWQDLPADFSKYSSTFYATQKEVVSITFEPQQQQCLWVLRPAYQEVRFLSAEAYRWMSMSNLDRIQSQSNNTPNQIIFGNEPEHTWCYYYQKADLASQNSDWTGIIRLWDEASNQGFRPRASVELLPFIEAFGKTGDWSTAQELTIRANVLPPRAPSLYCTLWKNLEKSSSPSELRDQSISTINQKLKCQE